VVDLSDDFDRIDDLDPPAGARAWVYSSLWLLGVLSGVIAIAAATGVPEPAFETLVIYSIGAASMMLTIALFAVVWQVHKSSRLNRRQLREARHRAGRRRS
jgi:cytochrome c biogenesis protein CcdA